MIEIEPKDLSIRDIHRYLLGGVQPRPIALVSTVSGDGVNNLAPFSFFNAFGESPPMVAFSTSRRSSDGSLKDTHNNFVETGECVIQSVTHAMVEQVSLASAEFPKEVDEFLKSGLTPIDSDIVKPKRVKESPFQMECRLFRMVPLGDQVRSGNLAICEVVKFHIAEDIFRDGVIHPDLIDLVGRNSAHYYTRASGSAVIEVPRPDKKGCIGFDCLPEALLRSPTYTPNNLAQFACADSIPTDKKVSAFIEKVSPFSGDAELKQLFHRSHRRQDYHAMLRAALPVYESDRAQGKFLLEKTAKCALENGGRDFAWKTALFALR
ncbi:flavin reductase family protein [candidate division KSB1 bacterium]